MNATNKRVAVVLLSLTFLFVSFGARSLAQTTRGGADIAVVVHPETPVSDLTLSEVRQVLLGERQYWNSKLPVVLLIRAPVARERDVVAPRHLSNVGSAFKQYWVAKIFRAEAASPPRLSIPTTCQFELVSAFPGNRVHGRSQHPPGPKGHTSRWSPAG